MAKSVLIFLRIQNLRLRVKRANLAGKNGIITGGNTGIGKARPSIYFDVLYFVLSLVPLTCFSPGDCESPRKLGCFNHHWLSQCCAGRGSSKGDQKPDVRWLLL